MHPTSAAAIPPSFRYRLLIADDHAIVRSALRLLLETPGCFEVIAEAEDGEEALAKIVEFTPDVALVDISMPKMNGIEVARRITESAVPSRVLTVSMLEDENHVRAALSAGAAGFIPKTASSDDLLAAVRAVASGGHYVHNRVVGALIADCNRPPHPSLSEREREVLRWVAAGYTAKETAGRMNLSVKSVETYKGRASKKIGARSRSDIVRYAQARGWGN